MQDSKNRRGRRPIVTVLVSERRFPGGREFRFAPAEQGEPVRRAPLSATLTARAFAWRDEDAANEASFGPSGAGATNEASRVGAANSAAANDGAANDGAANDGAATGGAANAPAYALAVARGAAPEIGGVENGAPRNDAALADVLRDLRRVYHASRRGRVPKR